METYLAVDLGGSKYMVAVIDEAGRILSKRRRVWETLSRETVLSAVIEESRSILEETGVRPAACGITIPGLADPASGTWVEASFSGIRDFPICNEISKALGIPAFCDNDGQAYALGEMIFGCCKNTSDFIFMNVSNGIGGSAVSAGKLLTGHRNFAGESGHCNVVPDGRPCKCGRLGCLEMYASGPAISKTYAEKGGRKETDCKTVAEMARKGDPASLEAFEEAGMHMGRILAVAVNILNPRRIVLGGGVSLAFDLFFPALKRSLDKGIYEYANRDLEILPTPLGYEAGLYGAAAIAITNRR